MSADVVIRAEGLGKRYTLGGGPSQGERYVALRDVMARAPRTALRRAAGLLGRRGGGAKAGDQTSGGEFWALRDIGFEVRRGETVGVIGRNGAGKSTLLKVLSRITEPTEGRVTIAGRVASLLEVGTGFHPELTGRENIYLNGAILGMSRAEIRRKFDEIVAFAEVERFLDTPVKRYSSGMYVRLAFAVAAHLEPEILVVDEVLAVGDAEFQKKCLGKMSSVAHDGRTVLFVSHNMGAVASLCGRALLLERGALIKSGPTRDIITAYSTTSAARFGEARFQERGRPSIVAVRVDHQEALRRNLQVEIEFHSDQPIARPIGGVVIHSQAGAPVWGSNGVIHAMPLALGSRTAGSIVCSSQGLPILPGEYTLSAWLSDWTEVLDYQPDCLSLQIGVEDQAVVRPPVSVTGHVDWEANWAVV